MKSNKVSNILLASLLVLCFAGAVALLFYPSNSPLGRFFDLFFILMVTRYLGLIYGVIVLLLRILKVIENNGMLVYTLAGSLNIFLALAGYVLYLMNWANMEWLHNSIQNLFIGFIIISDIVLLPRTSK